VPGARPSKPETRPQQAPAKRHYDTLFLVGRPSFFATTTCKRAFSPGHMIFDPLLLGSTEAVQQVGGIEPDFLRTAATPTEMFTAYRGAIAARRPRSLAFVVMGQPSRTQLLGCLTAARAEEIDVFYMSEEDEGTVLSATDHQVAFSAPLALGVDALLDMMPTVQILDPGAEPPDDDRLLKACAMLAQHSECCSGLVLAIIRQWGQSLVDRPIWLRSGPGWMHTEDVVPDLRELERVVLRTVKGREGGLGFMLKDTDSYAALFNQGQWLELAAAALLSKRVGVHDRRLRVKVRVKGLGEREVDLLASTGSSLLIVECKTGLWNRGDLEKLGDLREALQAPVFLVTATRDRGLDQTASDRKVNIVHAADLAEDTSRCLVDAFGGTRGA
jgi:hypothetical protein